MIHREMVIRRSVTTVALGLAGLFALSGCASVKGTAPLPNGEGVVSVDNPIKRAQVSDVTAEGRVITRRLVGALVGGGMVVGEKSSESWRSCMAAEEAVFGHSPQNGIQYVAWIYLTPKTDIAKPVGLVQHIGKEWDTAEKSSKSKSGVFSLDLSVINEVQLLVMSPCYFVHKVDKGRISNEELDSLGGFAREPWAQ